MQMLIITFWKTYKYIDTFGDIFLVQSFDTKCFNLLVINLLVIYSSTCRFLKMHNLLCGGAVKKIVLELKLALFQRIYFKTLKEVGSCIVRSFQWKKQLALITVDTTLFDQNNKKKII